MKPLTSIFIVLIITNAVIWFSRYDPAEAAVRTLVTTFTYTVVCLILRWLFMRIIHIGRQK